jgi:ketosteroid isomerase-like protein
METLKSEWDTFRVTLDGVVRDDGDTMVVIERLSGRGRESGIEVEMQVFSAYWATDDGKIVRRNSFRTPEEALAAL